MDEPNDLLHPRRSTFGRGDNPQVVRVDDHIISNEVHRQPFIEAKLIRAEFNRDGGPRKVEGAVIAGKLRRRK